MTSLGSKNLCKVTITNKKEINLSYTWKIHNFKNRPEKKGEKIESPSFSSGLNYGDDWCILCYPRGKEDEEGDAVAILLWLKSSIKPVIDAKFKVSIFDDYDETCKEKNIKNSGKIYEFIPRAGKGFNRFINRDDLFDLLLTNDDLVLLCTVTIIEKIASYELDAKPHFSLSLSNQLGKFFEQQQFGDITFIISGRKLHAHKAILAARSPIFAQMFQRKNISPQDHSESSLIGVHYEAFKELLYFIYTNLAPNLYSMSPYLLILADQYEILGLKDLCEQEFLANLDIEKAAQFLCVADQSKSWKLKATIINFINTNLHKVLETRGFRTMKNKYPDMVVELLRATQQSSSNYDLEINRIYPVEFNHLS